MENHLAENIRSARKRAGLTQEQLADRLGITLGTVSKWERGASEPEIGFLMDLAEVFRISVDALIGFSMKGGDAATEAERIENLFGNAEFEDILDQYKQALKRFPNYFRPWNRWTILCSNAHICIHYFLPLFNPYRDLAVLLSSEGL